MGVKKTKNKGAFKVPLNSSATQTDPDQFNNLAKVKNLNRNERKAVSNI